MSLPVTPASRWDIRYLPRGFVLGITVVLLAALALSAWTNRGSLQPDGVAYIRLAHHYLQGETALAVSGYWGPMVSWLLVPALAAGIPDLAATRVVMVFSGLCLWLASLLLVRRTRLRGNASGLFLAVMAFAAIDWGASAVSPDPLFTALFAAAIAWLLGPDWLTRRNPQVVAGILFGISYLTKSVGLPLAVLVVTGAAGYWYFDRRFRRRQVVVAWLTTLIVTLALSLPWVALISRKAGKLIFSQSAYVANALMAPPGIAIAEVTTFEIFHDPAPGRLNSWEDPLSLPYPTWSPFSSARNALHEVRVILRNLERLPSLLHRFDVFGISLMAAFVALLTFLGWSNRSTGLRWRLYFVPVVCLVALYLPTYSEVIRYYYPAYPFLLLGSLGCAGWLERKIGSGQGLRRGLLTGLTALSFAVPVVPYALLTLVHTRHVAQAPVEAGRELSRRMQQAGLTGSLAGGRFEGFYASFFHNVRWHGDRPNPTVSDCEALLGRVRFLLVDRRAAILPELGRDARFRDITDRVYSNQETNGFAWRLLELGVPATPVPVR